MYTHTHTEGLIYQSCVGMCANLSAGIMVPKDTCDLKKISYMANPIVRHSRSIFSNMFRP